MAVPKRLVVDTDIAIDHPRGRDGSSVEFDDSSAEKSGRVLAELESKGITLDPRDLLIGCISVSHGYPILTNNPKHFTKIPELLVIKPSDLKLPQK